MNKIINKALLYKEWINVKYVTVLTTLMLLYFKLFNGVMYELNMNQNLMKETGRLWTDRWFNNGIFKGEGYFLAMVFLIMILSIVLFTGEKTSETQGFIASMPFTRKQIIMNKWIIGVISILISFVITFIALSLFYGSNLNVIDTNLNPYSDIVKWFFIDVFQYIGIFTFIMFVQTVMGNSIVSAIVGGILLLVPWFLTITIQELIIRIGNYGYNDQIIITFDQIKKWINIYYYNLLEQEWYHVDGSEIGEMFRTFWYQNYELKIGIIILFTLTFLCLACIFYKKRKLEYNLRLIAFEKFEWIFICGVSICMGLFIGAILGFTSDNGVNMFLLWTIAGTILGYIVSKLVIKMFNYKG